MDMRIIISNGLHIRFKELPIDCVEADDRNIKPDIDLGKGRSKIIGTRSTAQVFFNPVKTFEELIDSIPIRGLRLRHTCFTIQ